MTEQEINDLTIATRTEYGYVASILSMRLLGTDVPVCTVVDTALPDYDRILMDDGYAKPTLEMFESELSEYKAELQTIRLEQEAALAEAEQAEAERLAQIEAERLAIEADRARREAILTAYRSNIQLAINDAGSQQKNWLTYIDRTVRESVYNTNEQGLVEYETKVADYMAIKEAENQKLLIAKAAVNTVHKCLKAIEYIVGFNQAQYTLGNIDDAGLDALEETFSSIFKSLQGYRPKKAIGLIQAVDLTGTIYTEEERTAILDILGA